jgi:signal transduction histidine kinase
MTPMAAGPPDPAPGRSDATMFRSGLRAFLRTPFTARTWREHLYLAIAAALGLAGFIALAILLYVSLLLSITLIGIPLLALTVLAAREWAGLHRLVAGRLLDEHVPTPGRRRPRSPGFFSWLGAGLTDVAGWRSMAHIVASFPVVIVGLWAAIVAWAGALALLAYPVMWHLFEPTNTDANGVAHHSGLQFGEFYIDTWPRALAVSAAGLVGVFLIPWFVRGVTTVEGLLVRGLLGPTRLSERVVDLEATRAQAVDASAATLRRIERDLHDGTQARLVALAMQLDMAKEKLAGAGRGGTGAYEADLVRARDLVDTAHRNATEAIVELRDVTRTIHPPALDRGLDAALATLAARSALPVSLRTEIAVRPSPAIETIAYFCVAELLTNAAKHSRARLVTLEATGGRASLRLRVSDDGIGGAHLVAGGGLDGLAGRVRIVDGQLHVVSPAGGPTTVTVELPTGA